MNRYKWVAATLVAAAVIGFIMTFLGLCGDRAHRDHGNHAGHFCPYSGAL